MHDPADGEAAARDALVAWLAQLEEAVAAGEDPGADIALVYIAREDVLLDEDDLHGALRRAVLLRATGGDPRRELDPDERAVSGLAEELDDPVRRAELTLRAEKALAVARAELTLALEEVEELVAELPGLVRLARTLRSEPDRTWRLFALALLADHLDEDDDPT